MTIEATYDAEAALAIAAEAGYLLTRSQLKRLRSNGLIRTPEQHHSIGVAGSSTAYTQADVDQLLTVLSLRHDLGYDTFDKLRVAAWLVGLDVDLYQLRPNAVDILRCELKEHQGLRAGTEDDQVSSRLKSGLADASDAELDEVNRLVLDAGRETPATFEDVVFPMLQLVLQTPQMELGRELLDQQLRVENPDEMGISDLYSDWEVPATSRWPRIISRSGKSAFAFGQKWLVGIHGLLMTDVFQRLLASPLAKETIDRVAEGLADETPANLQRRNFFACQGIIIFRASRKKLEHLFAEH